MILRALGHTGIHVSLLGLGTVKFGRNAGLRYPAPFELPTEHELQVLMGRARDLGINLLDTAPAYGESEERLGRALRGTRNEWVLSTKVGEEFEGGRSRFDFTAAHVRHSVERSLKRLRTDRIDLVLVHSDGSDTTIVLNGETLEALAALKVRGLIRAFGFSHKTLDGGLEAVTRSDVVMTTLNLDDPTMMPVIERAASVGCGVLVKKALSAGFAATREARRASLTFAAGTPGVSAVVVGTLDPQHLADNVHDLSSVHV